MKLIKKSKQPLSFFAYIVVLLKPAFIYYLYLYFYYAKVTLTPTDTYPNILPIYFTNTTMLLPIYSYCPINTAAPTTRFVTRYRMLG